MLELRGSFLHFLAKWSPYIVPVYVLIYGLLYNSTRAFLFFFGSLGSSAINVLLKELSGPVCESSWYPIKLLGTCMRPVGTVACSIIGDGILFNGQRKIGMPSGHAQYAAFTASYWTAYLLKYRKHAVWKWPAIVGMVLAALFVMYSRVALSQCHTTVQVVIGAIIGVALGLGYYYYNQKYLHSAVEEVA